MKTGRRIPLLTAAAPLALAAVLTACGGGDGDAAKADTTAVARSAAPVETTAASSTSGIRRVTPSAFAAVLQQEPTRVLLDLRTPDEMSAGHLAGAKDLDFYSATFDQDLAALDRATPYAVYCHSGNRSGQTVAKMKLLGFQDVVELEGGIAAWQSAGLPVTTA